MLIKKRKLRAPQTMKPWDDRHHLCDSQNELKPPQLRQYFSRPQSLPELRSDIAQRPNSKAILKKLDSDEGPAQPQSFITADAGPSCCPLRHAQGGDMLDRDGVPCPWNNRWSSGIHILNEQMHPLHRSSFATKSLFETAPSQRWRRHLDVQDEYGEWRPTATTTMPRFQPLGV